MDQQVQIIVSGRVQGVCFRATTQQTARHLGLRGLVRNLQNGGVEIIAQGASGAIADLISWCRTGPPLARVNDLAVKQIPKQENLENFEIR